MCLALGVVLACGVAGVLWAVVGLVRAWRIEQAIRRRLPESWRQWHTRRQDGVDR